MKDCQKLYNKIEDIKTLFITEMKVSNYYYRIFEFWKYGIKKSWIWFDYIPYIYAIKFFNLKWNINNIIRNYDSCTSNIL